MNCGCSWTGGSIIFLSQVSIAAVDPFLKSLTCCWHMLYFRVVTLSYFSRNRRKEERIGRSQFALFYWKNSPPYSSREKLLEPIMTSFFSPGVPAEQYTLFSTCCRASSQQISSFPVSLHLGNLYLHSSCGVIQVTRRYGGLIRIARDSRQAKS